MPRRSLRSQSANKKLVSKPTQTFTRRTVPKKQSEPQAPPKKELPKKKRTFSFAKKKETKSAEAASDIKENLPKIAKELETGVIKETVVDEPTPAKPLKRQHISMVTSVRAVIIAAAVSLVLIVVAGAFSIRIGKDSSQGLFAVSKLSYAFHEPERFDVVQVQLADGNTVLAQIAGLPDEQVYERADDVYIQLPNRTGFSMTSFSQGTIRLAPLALDGKHTLLNNSMHYIVPLGAVKGKFVSREAIIGRMIWD